MSSSPLQDVYALRKKCVEQSQLPTPHPSSSTQCAPSSPRHDYRARVLPSIQYARPSFDGHWFGIGRSSASNDLALPSNNRLVSRTHAKIRYIAAENALEVKCIGYNGISLRIADQTMYIRRNTGVMVQIHEDCEIGLDIAGSLVDIEVPTTCQSEERDVLAPSSPSIPAAQPETALDIFENTDQIKQDDQQSISQIEPLSPLPSSTGMVTPSITPDVYRIRTDEPESSPEEVHEIHLAQPEDEDEDESEDTSQHKALQPRKLNFSNISHSYAQPTSKADLQGVGKENIPPEEDHTKHDSYENIFNTSAAEEAITQPEDVLPTEVKQELDLPVAEPVVDAGCAAHAFEPEPIAHETRRDDAQLAKDNQVDIEAAAELAEMDESPLKTATDVKASNDATGTCLADSVSVSESLETTASKADEFDLNQLDQEFIDMILTVLATSVISPAPISLLTPFFPPETDSKAIESFLRTQSCITELVWRNEFSQGESYKSASSSSSSWSYDSRNDTDLVRRARLAQLQKPQRTLRKRTYQQMHTYEYEHAKYVMDCKAAGIKPVRFDGVRYRGTHSSQVNQ